MGTRVVAVDISPAKLDLARELGADVMVDASGPKPAEVIRKLGGAHVVINLAPTPAAVSDAVSALPRGGTLVLVGLGKAMLRRPGPFGRWIYATGYGY